MEGVVDDCLIDLNSPVPINQRASLIPVNSIQKQISTFSDFAVPAIDDNNPFDLMVQQTERNEADKNDPFEIAFEQAYGHQDSSKAVPDNTKDEVDSTRIGSEKPCEVLPDSKVLDNISPDVDECIDQGSRPCDDFDLDNIQPPDFLGNLSFELSDNDSITINDTLHLSSMSDLKLTPGETKSSPFKEEFCKVDKFLSGEISSPVSSKVKSSVCETAKIVLSPINFPSEPLSTSEKSSFEESPSKVLCELKSEESVKTLIESRIQKCIAKALNESHQKFRNSILFETGETSFVTSKVRQSSGNLRASLSVPQNLHLLSDDNCTKPEQSTICSPVGSKIFEDLTIPVLDQKNEARKSINLSFDITSFKTEGSRVTTGIQPKVELTPAMKDQKLSEYREIIEAELQKVAQNNTQPMQEVETEVKQKRHRRSVSCDVIIPPQFSPKGSSPPKLPPLPLSSDTIRDLSLCSKYSPPKSKGRSPNDITAKISNRPVPLPACAQPKLILKKKCSAVSNGGPVTATGSLGGAMKGPMKAIVPVRNMTRFAGGSPRLPAQNQNRKGCTALPRQSTLDSPNLQKSKLCPLAASTPSNPPDVNKAQTNRAPPVITAPSPRRIISSGIPSPNRRGSANSTAPSSKLDTPTRRSSVPDYGRRSNPRVLVDKNGLTSPSMTRVRKSSIQTDARPQLLRSNTLGKENMVCP